ncbi:MAG: tetratricopeptide repeat protein [Archangiaceae bacterium]|nr:tetratricopeptide repeat protein [Archangiaceae bacterium]
MTLPRDVKRLLDEPEVEASVARTWVRIVQTRSGSRPVGRLVLVAAAVAALVGWGLFAMRAPAPAFEPAVALKSVVVPPAATSSSNLASVMMQGRSRRLSRPPVQDSGSVEVDVVAQLLESSVEAFVEGDAQRAAVLLEETVTHHADDARTTEALVTLGWLQLEHLNQPEQAVRTLNMALERHLSDELFDRAWPLLQTARAKAAARPKK